MNVKAASIITLGPPTRSKIIKVKGYQHDTIAIIWYDGNGNDVCDVSEFYEKKDGYFIVKGISCKRADDIDQFILEPKI
jgi:hypothetical protein